METTLSERAQAVLARINSALIATGRPANSVRLVAASKRRPTEEIKQALALGISRFGENYVPELLEKQTGVPEAEFHFIGHLQRNKARRLLASGVRWIHTIDRLRLATTIQQYVEHPIHTLIQVNIGMEPTKSGVLPDDVLKLAQSIIMECPDIGLCGLMTLPPKDQQPKHWFEALAALRDDLEQKLSYPLPELSMGMSSDLEQAIQCGATLVRVGSALFGPRPH